MRLIRTAIVSVDTTVGAVSSNLKKAIEIAKKLGDKGVTLAVFQEQLLGGYPAEDFIHSSEFIREQWNALYKFADATASFKTAFVLGLAVRVDGMTYNAAAMVCRGQIIGITPKEHLPTYGVFYEARVFARGIPGLYKEINGIPFGDLVYEFPFGTVASPTCEDSWVTFRREIAEIQAIPNASPARMGITETRHQMLATRSADNECVILAAYQVGGNDALVFDGGGYCFQSGQLIGEMERFHEGYMIFDVDLSRTDRMRNQNSTWRTCQEMRMREPEIFHRIKVEAGWQCNHIAVSPEFAKRFSFLPTSPLARNAALQYMINIAVNGLKGYFEKSSANFKNILVALSGGKDSALTAMLAWLYAMERFRDLPDSERASVLVEFIQCFSMPSEFNSDETKSIARSLCEDFGLKFSEDSIQEAIELERRAVRRVTGREIGKVPDGNMHTRIRGSRMWNVSNVTNGLWLQTGNMSEKAVGYTCPGGDLMGGYSLLGNIPKTVIIELLMYLGTQYKTDTITRLVKMKASAELAKDQYDEDDLMPFPVLDMAYLLYVGEWYSPEDMYKIMRARWDDAELKDMDPRYAPGVLKMWIVRFLKLFSASIFKWVQAPLAVHIGSLDLDRERALQIPVIHSLEFIEKSIERMKSLP